jgi:hypothetical protein
MNTFRLPNIDFAYAEITIITDDEVVDGTAVINDITYDKKINFDTLMRTEDSILNPEPEKINPTTGLLESTPLNYEGQLALPVVEVGLGTEFGEWVFEQDPLGNSLNIVKTVKLSGKGYNIKTVFVDFTKSKWTLETLGIAYKLGRTRS